MTYFSFQRQAGDKGPFKSYANNDPTGDADPISQEEIHEITQNWHCIYFNRHQVEHKLPRARDQKNHGVTDRQKSNVNS